MHNQKLVSVIIPAFNCEKYISQAITSVLNQKNYTNFEIIIIDDGSTDNTHHVVDSFLGDKRVKFIRQSNQGPSSARNTGIMASKGEFIAFLDADDMWYSDKLMKQIPIFDLSEKIGLVYTHFEYMDENGNPFIAQKKAYKSGFVLEELLVSNFVSGMTSIIKKSCIENVGLFNTSYFTGEDYDLWLRISAKYELFYFDEITYCYRQWEGQSTNQNKKLIYGNAFKIMDNFLKDHNGLIDNKIINKAYCHTYTGMGDSLIYDNKCFREVIECYFKALSYKINYLPLWKSIIKVLLKKTGLRRRL